MRLRQLLVLLATLTVAGTCLAVPSDRVLDGRDLGPLLTGRTQGGPHSYFHYMGGSTEGRVNYRGVRDERWKLVVTVDAAGKISPQQLYDLGADIGEKFDRLKNHPDVVARLTGVAQQFYAEISANTRPAGHRADRRK